MGVNVCVCVCAYVCVPGMKHLLREEREGEEVSQLLT